MDPDVELTAARERVVRLDSLKQAVETLRANRARAGAALRTSADKVAAEQRRVEALDGIGLVALWSAITGTRSEKLQKEQRELEGATADHERLQHDVDEFDERVTQMQAEIKSLTNAPSDYERLASEKQRTIVSRGGETAERLVELSDEVSRWRDALRTLREALLQAYSANLALEQAETSLRPTEDWSPEFAGSTEFLPFLGAMKAGNRAEAINANLQLARRSLMDFERCCADLELVMATELELVSYSFIPDVVRSQRGELWDPRMTFEDHPRVLRVLKELHANVTTLLNERATIVERLRDAETWRFELLVEK